DQQSSTSTRPVSSFGFQNEQPHSSITPQPSPFGSSNNPADALERPQSSVTTETTEQELSSSAGTAGGSHAGISDRDHTSTGLHASLSSGAGKKLGPVA